MGEPRYVNIFINTDVAPPTPTRGTGTVGIMGYTPRVDTGYIGDEILLSTTGDLTVSTSGSTITRASGSWLTDGLTVGDKVVLVGTATNTNDGTYTITVITTTVLTFASLPADETITDQTIISVFDTSNLDLNDPAVVGELKRFSNLTQVQDRYGANSALARSCTEAIQNNVSMPIWLMPITASDATYDRGTAGETYASGALSKVLTNFPVLPVTIYEGTNPLVEGLDPNSGADFYVDVGNKKIIFHTIRAASGIIYYRSIQTADLTANIAKWLNKVVNLFTIAYGMGQSTIQTEIFNHILAASTTTKPRIGIIANASGSNSLSIASTFANDRIVAINHYSPKDICSMAAATASRITPQTSLLLKPISGDLSTANFDDSDYENFITNQIISVVNSEYIFGQTYRWTESFTLSTNSFKKYLDAMRVIDDVSFKVKATFTNPSILGTIKLATIAGMSRIRSTAKSLMSTIQSEGEIDDYSFTIPGEEIVNSAVGQRTAEEQATLASMISSRKFRIKFKIIYSGAVHYLDINLNFSNV